MSPGAQPSAFCFLSCRGLKAHWSFLNFSSQVTLQLWPHVPQTKTHSGFTSDPSACNSFASSSWMNFWTCLQGNECWQNCPSVLWTIKWISQSLSSRIVCENISLGYLCRVSLFTQPSTTDTTFATYLWAILAVSGICVVKKSDCCSTTCPLLENSAFSFTVAAFAQRNRTDTSLCQRRVSSCWR